VRPMGSGPLGLPRDKDGASPRALADPGGTDAEHPNTIHVADHVRHDPPTRRDQERGWRTTHNDL